MVCHLKHNQRQLSKAFLKDSNPRVDLPYTYLMAWFVSYYERLIFAGPTTLDNEKLLDLFKYENMKWASEYLVDI